MLNCRSLCNQVCRIWGQWISAFWILWVVLLTVPNSYPICFLKYFTPWLLSLAWGCRVQIICCLWQVLLEQGSDVSPCSAVCDWMGVNSQAGNSEENTLVLYTRSQMVTEIIKISNAWKMTLLQSTQSRDGIPVQTKQSGGVFANTVWDDFPLVHCNPSLHPFLGSADPL